jgi:ATP-dependent RNA helicase DeaD
VTVKGRSRPCLTYRTGTKKGRRLDFEGQVCQAPALFMADDVFSALPAALATALTKRGFTSLTAIQQAVLADGLDDRDLRISSRTGSGKTVALGLVLGPKLAGRTPTSVGGAQSLVARPLALLVAPTRELAAQIGKELEWLYADLKLRVCVVTGGTSVGLERRALAQSPAVVVGTPGRLCDHLSRGALDLGQAEAIVLDEADQMLDLGFREALETLLGALPENCRRHLVSATFPRAVLNLATRFQKNALTITGDSADQQHSDITHIAYQVLPRERYPALVNILLLNPEERTLVFVRTRADVTQVASRLVDDGFRAGGLSGEMAQAERTRTLEAFRKGSLSVLVCTDVASRGIDIPEVSRVIHAELPESPESLTHRSGRTGRAGRKGTSVMLVPNTAHRFAEMLLRNAGIFAELLPAPTTQEVEQARDERLFEELGGETQVSPNHQELAERLLEKFGPEALVPALLARLLERELCAPYALSPVSVARMHAVPAGPRRESKARSSNGANAVFRPRAKPAHFARHR